MRLLLIRRRLCQRLKKKNVKERFVEKSNFIGDPPKKENLSTFSSQGKGNLLKDKAKEEILHDGGLCAFSKFENQPWPPFLFTNG